MFLHVLRLSILIRRSRWQNKLRNFPFLQVGDSQRYFERFYGIFCDSCIKKIISLLRFRYLFKLTSEKKFVWQSSKEAPFVCELVLVIF